MILNRSLVFYQKGRTLENIDLQAKRPQMRSFLLNGASDGNRTHEYRNHNPGP